MPGMASGDFGPNGVGGRGPRAPRRSSGDLRLSGASALVKGHRPPQRVKVPWEPCSPSSAPVGLEVRPRGPLHHYRGGDHPVGDHKNRTVARKHCSNRRVGRGAGSARP